MSGMGPEARERVTWALGAALVVVTVLGYLWWSAPEDDPLPAVYSVL